MVVDMKGIVVYASENITGQLGPQLVSVCSAVTVSWRPCERGHSQDLALECTSVGLVAKPQSLGNCR